MLLKNSLSAGITFDRQVMEQTIERIPTISTQLKIVATVKATMIGANGKQ